MTTEPSTKYEIHWRAFKCEMEAGSPAEGASKYCAALWDEDEVPLAERSEMLVGVQGRAWAGGRPDVEYFSVTAKDAMQLSRAAAAEVLKRTRERESQIIQMATMLKVQSGIAGKYISPEAAIREARALYHAFDRHPF